MTFRRGRQALSVAGVLLAATTLVGCGSGGVNLPSQRPSVALPTASLPSISLPSRSPQDTTSPTPTPTSTPTSTATKPPTESPSTSASSPESSKSSSTPTPTPMATRTPTFTATVTPTLTPTTSPAAGTGEPSAWGTWLWVLLALALLVAFLFYRRRSADRAALAQRRGAWQQSAREQVPALRAMAAAAAALRLAPDATAEQAGDLRRRADLLADQTDRLAAAAVTAEDATLAREGAEHLRAFATAAQAEVLQRTAATPPTAAQLSAADTASRQAETDLNAVLQKLENPTGQPPTAG